MSWYARSYVNGINEFGSDDWISLNNVMNSINDGTTFMTSGRELQLRGLARTQFVSIYETKLVPKYATLGNFIKR